MPTYFINSKQISAIIKHRKDQMLKVPNAAVVQGSAFVL
jgi:hypothetical protein